MAGGQPGVERGPCGWLTQPRHARGIEPQPVRLGLEPFGEGADRQGCRPTHRAKAITSLAGGIAASSP